MEAEGWRDAIVFQVGNRMVRRAYCPSLERHPGTSLRASRLSVMSNVQNDRWRLEWNLSGRDLLHVTESP